MCGRVYSTLDHRGDDTVILHAVDRSIIERLLNPQFAISYCHAPSHIYEDDLATRKEGGDVEDISAGLGSYNHDHVLSLHPFFDDTNDRHYFLN